MKENRKSEKIIQHLQEEKTKNSERPQEISKEIKKHVSQ